MDAIGSLLDFVFHIDVHLATFVRAYGTWVYALLFAIIFIETGVVVMPFLPGDSLLFVVGAMCAAGLMSLPLVLGLLWLAAVLGNQSNYAIGRITTSGSITEYHDASIAQPESSPQLGPSVRET